MADTNDQGETFGEWLLAQKGREGLIGSLVAAAKADPKFPRRGSPDDVRKRMNEMQADGTCTRPSTTLRRTGGHTERWAIGLQPVPRSPGCDGWRRPSSPPPPSSCCHSTSSAQHPNPRRKGKPTGDRQMEILLCEPGDPVTLKHEATNAHDHNAIAVYSSRGLQIGYIAADRTNVIHRAWQAARKVTAIFQERVTNGAAIRLAFDGVPVLPVVREPAPRSQPDLVERDSDPADDGFYPDYIPPDD